MCIVYYSFDCWNYLLFYICILIFRCYYASGYFTYVFNDKIHFIF